MRQAGVVEAGLASTTSRWHFTIFGFVTLGFWILPFAWLLDHLWPLWDGRRQALHDKVVASVVIRLPPTNSRSG
jgi:uncharacterized RDD family membrane protein YckC